MTGEDLETIKPHGLQSAGSTAKWKNGHEPLVVDWDLLAATR